VCAGSQAVLAVRVSALARGRSRPSARPAPPGVGSALVLGIVVSATSMCDVGVHAAAMGLVVLARSARAPGC